MALTRIQKNALFEALIYGGLDPVECDLTEEYSTTHIDHQASKSFFEVVILQENFGDPNCIARMRIDDKEGLESGSGVPWEGVIRLIRKWAADIRIFEQAPEIPDLWEELRRQKGFFSDPRLEDNGNAPFAANEQAEIAEQLRQIKEYVKKTYSLTAEQMSRVEARLDDAEAASRRMGRKDWILLFGGALFSLIVSGVVTPDVVQHILIVALHGLGHLFGGDGKPSQLGRPPS